MTAILVRAAIRRGLACEVLDEAYLRLGHGSMQHFFYASPAGINRLNRRGANVALSDALSRLQEMGLPIVGGSDGCTADKNMGRYWLLIIGGRLVSAVEIRKEAVEESGRTFRDVTDQVHEQDAG